MPFELSSYSRFQESQPLIYRGVETWGLTAKMKFIRETPTNFYQKFVITGDVAGRPDLLSLKLYESPYYFWVLLGINRVKDVFDWPKVGETILVLPREIVVANL
jgi:hypothetical protein